MHITLNNISKLELFWIACLGYSFLSFVFSILAGSVDRSKDRPQPDEQTLSFYQFRKRFVYFNVMVVLMAGCNHICEMFGLWSW